MDAVAGANSAVLVAARNEFESFQLAIRAVGTPLHDVTVSWERPLVGPDGDTIPARNVTIYAERYLDVKMPSDIEGAPGRWPDALVPTVDTLVGEPRNAFPVLVPDGESRVAWIDVLVPPEATPGVYVGTVSVHAGGGLSASVPVQLTVLSFTLPSTASLKTSFGFSDLCRAFDPVHCDGDSDFRATLRQRFVEAALDDRVTLATPFAISLTRGRSYGVDEFRRYFLPFLKGESPTRLSAARLTTFRVNSHTDRNITGWKDELEADGFGELAYVWSCDEPNFSPVLGDPVGNWRICRAKLEADTSAWPDAPKMVTTHIQNLQDEGNTSLIDTITLNIELLDGPPGSDFPGDQRHLYDAFLADPSRLKQLWLYSACGSHGCVPEKDAVRRGWAGGYQIDGPASQTRAMPWIAFTHRMQGIFYYDTVQLLATAWDDQYRYTGNGEGTFFYPGTPDRIGGQTPIPIESIRLKLLRDGLEDYEYLKFASEHGREADALRIAAALFPAPYDTSRSDGEIQAAREFWVNQGFKILEENAQAGYLETDWAENKAKRPHGVLQDAIGRVVDGLFDSGFRDRYRMRLERAPGGGTEIYVTHYGMEEQVTGWQKDNAQWVARPNDPGLEAEMLSKLMVALGAGESAARSAVASATAASGAASAAATGSEHARVVTGQPGATLTVDDGFDRAWRRVGLALDHGGFTVEDRDRAQGLYFVRFVDAKEAAKDEPGFFSKMFSWFGTSDEKSPVGKYRIQIKGETGRSTVTVLDNTGKPTNDGNAQRIVVLLVDELK